MLKRRTRGGGVLGLMGKGNCKRMVNGIKDRGSLR